MGNAYTQQRAGNWNVLSNDPTSPWYDGGTQTGWAAYPGDTDTITNSNSSYTLTVPAGFTATIGASGATGTVALTTNATFTVNGTFIWKGDVKVTATGGSVWGPGAVIQGNAPSGAVYKWWLGNGYGNYAPLIATGTTNSRITCTSVGVGAVTLAGGTGQSNGHIQAQYVDFSNLGASGSSAFNFIFNPDAPQGLQTTDFYRCTVDRCWRCQTNSNMKGGDTYSWRESVVTNCQYTFGSIARFIETDFAVAKTTGTRQIKDCVFTDGLAVIKFRDATVQGNYFGNGIYGAPATTNILSSFKYNIYIRNYPNAGADLLSFSADTNFFYGAKSDALNPHGYDPSSDSGDLTWTNNVFENASGDKSGDVILPRYSAGVVNYKLTLSYNLWLPNPNGDNSGTPVTLYGESHLKLDVLHNTWIMGTQGFAISEGPHSGGGYVGYAGMIDNFESNLGYNFTNLGGYLLWDSLYSDPWDAASAYITVMDYNGAYNYSTSTTAGASPNSADSVCAAKGIFVDQAGNSHYPFPSGYVPDVHGVRSDPQLYDSNRCLPMFDQGYLGKAPGTAWATATAYSVGDIVSAQTSGVYRSQAVNFRCVQAHTSSSGSSSLGKPGLGTPGSLKTWSAYWEPASLYWIREAIKAGTTYTDTSLSLTSANVVQALIAWVKRGWMPTSTSYRTAGHDGATIGAVAYVSVSTATYLSGGGEGPFFNFLEA